MHCRHGRGTISGISGESDTMNEAPLPRNANPAHIPTAATFLPDLQAEKSTQKSWIHFDLQHGRAEEAISQSQPMSLTTSGSSLSSVKDDDPGGPSPYGTRSRNRSTARPNYSEDLEMDFNQPRVKIAAASGQGPAPAVQSSGFHAVNGTHHIPAHQNGQVLEKKNPMTSVSYTHLTLPTKRIV